jgi:hypothetical protein
LRLCIVVSFLLVVLFVVVVVLSVMMTLSEGTSKLHVMEDIINNIGEAVIYVMPVVGSLTCVFGVFCLFARGNLRLNRVLTERFGADICGRDKFPLAAFIVMFVIFVSVMIVIVQMAGGEKGV